jgi:hypothetical protein
MTNSIRNVLLETIAELQPRQGGYDPGSLQSSSVLRAVIGKLGARRDEAVEQAVLAQYQELFRTGYLAWGLNLDNPGPPFFHIAERGRRALENFSRDPSNPAGYLSSIAKLSKISDICLAYVEEGLGCFTAGHFRAAAVMIGCAGERLVLELRDAIVEGLNSGSHSVPKNLSNRNIKTVLSAVGEFVVSHKKDIPYGLFESYEANWPATTGQIRAVRNDAGHPISLNAVTEDSVHASFLLFPEVIKLQSALLEWVKKAYP